MHYARYLCGEGRDEAAAQLLKEVVAEGVPAAPLLVEQAEALLNGRG